MKKILYFICLSFFVMHAEEPDLLTREAEQLRFAQVLYQYGFNVRAREIFQYFASHSSNFEVVTIATAFLSIIPLQDMPVEVMVLEEPGEE